MSEEASQKPKAETRIGIHLGDIVQKDGDVFGDGVNIAARLQTLANPDTQGGAEVRAEERGLSDQQQEVDEAQCFLALRLTFTSSFRPWRFVSLLIFLDEIRRDLGGNHNQSWRKGN